MRRQEEDQQRANFERYSAQHQQYNQQQRGYDYLKQHQDFLNDGHRRQPNERDLVGQVQDQLGALTGHGQALFGLSKDQNSNKGVNNNKNEVNHRVRPTSPRTSCKVEESRRDQEQQKPNFPRLPPNLIPSATPADTLPGFKPSIPSRDHKRQSHKFHLETTVDLKARDRATPQSVAGSDKDSHNSEPSGIPSCLLDSILETAKLPVWKPPDKTPDQQIASPAKPPVASPPKPAPVTSEHDSSFDDLLRHIDAPSIFQACDTLKTLFKIHSYVNDYISMMEYLEKITANPATFDNPQYNFLRERLKALKGCLGKINFRQGVFFGQ